MKKTLTLTITIIAVSILSTFAITGCMEEMELNAREAEINQLRFEAIDVYLDYINER